jgi:hypothetical protein
MRDNQKYREMKFSIGAIKSLDEACHIISSLVEKIRSKRTYLISLENWGSSYQFKRTCKFVQAQEHENKISNIGGVYESDTVSIFRNTTLTNTNNKLTSS